MAKSKEFEIQYKAEGKRRSRERKAKRYSTFKHRGHGCCRHGNNGWHSCPFESDMNDNPDERWCQCCRECIQSCAGDI